VEKRLFWGTFFVLSLTADLFLPFWWALGATVPILAVSWWIAHRGDWM
jgi:hypothetical protein